MTAPLPRSAALALLVLLAGCAAPSDFARPGTWQATGANNTNLAAMLADPKDAVRGVAATTERGQPASQAVRRLERDRRRPLPDSRLATVGAVAAPVAGPDATNGR